MHRMLLFFLTIWLKDVLLYYFLSAKVAYVARVQPKNEFLSVTEGLKYLFQVGKD